MQTLEKIKALISNVKYKDWKFVTSKKGDGFLIQVQFMGEDTDGSGKLELQKCRKWFVSQHSVDSEVIRSCFLAIRQAEEHELCERFMYKGQQVYNPHLDMDRMADFICAKPFEVRTEKISFAPNLHNNIKTLLGIKLHELKFSDNKHIDTRSFNVLREYRLETLADLVSLSKMDLLRFRNFGKKSLTAITDFIEKKDLTFNFDVVKYGFTKFVLP